MARLPNNGRAAPKAHRRLAVESLEKRCLLAGLATANALITIHDDDFEPGQLIVRIDEGYFSLANVEAASVVSSLQTQYGHAVLDASPLVGGLWRVAIDGSVDVPQFAATVQDHPAVIYAEPDFHIGVNLLPDDPQYSSLWGLDNVGQTDGTLDADIDASEAWSISTGSGNTIVAVIDTGVDYTHSDLAANIWTNQLEADGAPGVDDDGNGYVDDIHGYDFANRDGDPMDDHSHGTHVAGTIGAVGDNGTGVVGVNWNVQIMGVKFLDATGQGATSDAILAIDYAVANGATISNNSWGFNGGFSQSLYDSISRARDAGHIFLAAAGNGFYGVPLDNDARPFYPATFDLDNIVAVAATDHNDEMASFSNYGATTVDLAAPGVGILSTTPNDTYDTYSGTSMATPHTAGVVALLRDLNPTWPYQAIIDKLLTSVDPVAALEGKMVTGGRLNAANALIPDEKGPRVSTSSPTGDVYGTLSVLRVTFDEGIDLSTIALEDIVSFVGPAGAIAVDSINVVPSTANRQFDIAFPRQDTVGTYQLTFGPWIADLGGNWMDQDKDDQNGEDPDDQFTATINLLSPQGGPTDYLAYWKLDDASGSQALDASGNLRNGTLHGGLETTGWIEDTAPVTFPNVTALQFDGTNDYVSFPADGSLNIANNGVTLAAWVRLNELPGDISGDSYAGIFDAEQDAYVLYEDAATGELRFKVTDANGTAERPGIPESALDTAYWHHIVGVYDGDAGTASIYLDGQLIDTHTNPELVDAVRTGQVAALGRNGSGDQYFFNGSIDEVRVYGRALDGNEIAELAVRKPGIQLSPQTGLETGETGGEDAFEIVLQSAPQADVTIPLSSSDETEGVLDVMSVTFTPANWNVAQVVTVTGVDDGDIDGNVSYSIVTAPAVSLDPGYDGLDAEDVSVVNKDEDGIGGPADYIAYWKLDEGAGNTAVDSSDYSRDGTLHGGLEIAGWTAEAAPSNFENTSALVFDGVNDFVSLPAFDVSTNAVTLAMWVKLDELPNAIAGSDYAALFDSQQDTFVLYEDDKTDELRFKVTDADGTAERPGIPASSLDTSDWHHIAGVYDGDAGKAYIYLDGQLKDTHTNSKLTGVVKSGQYASLGRNGVSSSYYFQGMMDDVRVYERALDVEEILQLAAREAGISVVPTADLITTEGGAQATFEIVLDARPKSDVTIGVTSSDATEGIVSPSSVTFTPTNWFAPQVITVTGVDDQEVDSTVDYHAVTAAAVSSDPMYDGMDPSDVALINVDDDGPGGPFDYLAYWKLDEGDGTVAEDSSGNGLAGNLYNGLDQSGWVTEAAPTDFANLYALDFDGYSNYVALPGGGPLDIAGNAVSLSAWVKLDELPSYIGGESYAGIFDSEQDAYVLYLDKPNNELRFKVTDIDGSAERPGIPAANLDTDRWHHIVGIYDGSQAEARIYLDGVLMDTHSNPGLTGIVKPGQVPALGRNGAGNKYFYNGKIDDVRIYPRPLSEAEIDKLAGQVAQIAMLGFPVDPLPRSVVELPETEPDHGPFGKGGPIAQTDHFWWPFADRPHISVLPSPQLDRVATQVDEFSAQEAVWVGFADEPSGGEFRERRLSRDRTGDTKNGEDWYLRCVDRLFSKVEDL